MRQGLVGAGRGLFSTGPYFGFDVALLKLRLVDQLAEVLQARLVLGGEGHNALLDIPHGGGERILVRGGVSGQFCGAGLSGQCFEALQSFVGTRQRLVSACRGLLGTRAHFGLDVVLIKLDLVDELPEFVNLRFLLRRRGGKVLSDVSTGAGGRIPSRKEVSRQFCRAGLRGERFKAAKGFLGTRQGLVGAYGGLLTIESYLGLGLALLKLDLVDELPEFVNLRLLMRRKRHNALLDHLNVRDQFIAVGVVARLRLFRWHRLSRILA
ncbi:MAG: hypothetical protein ACHQ9S_14055 [Candidatus Binatia bacterium]